MTCNCKNEAVHDDNGGTTSNCGDGMTFDKDAGKCVKDKKTKSTEQLGDPQAQSTQGELPSGDAGGDQSDNSGNPCAEGMKWDATTQTCVPSDRKDPGDGQTQGTDKTQSVEVLKLTKEIAEIKKLIIGKESKTPTATILQDGRRSFTPTVEYKSLDDIAHEMVEALGNGLNYQFRIPLEYLRSINVGLGNGKHGVQEMYRSAPLKLQESYTKPNKLIKEAATLKEVVAISGTHATQDLDTDVAIIPGGISFIPVFQFAKVKQIEQGFDRARFFTSTIPANGTQTVGSTPTEATQTLTSIEVTPSVITGVYLVGDYDEIENSPFDLLQAIVEGSALAYDDFVATDMLTVVSGEAASFGLGLWIRGDTGATITSSDIASNTFDESGIFFGREYLENQGYLRGGIKPVCVMHPRQWRELMSTANVTSLATRSVPDIWLKAQLEEFGGVQIVVSNAVQNFTAQTNNAYNALMFVPKHSYGIAVKRDVTFKFHDIGEDNEIRVNTTWRTKTGVLDGASIVRISTTAP